MFNIVFATQPPSAPVQDLPSRVRVFSKSLALVAEEFSSIISGTSIVNIYQEGYDASADGGSMVSMASIRTKFTHTRA